MLQVLCMHMCVSVPHLHMLEDGLQGAVQLIWVLQFLPKIQSNKRIAQLR